MTPTDDQQAAHQRRCIDAAELARLVGARPLASGWWETRCPSHEDRSPSCNFRDDVFRDGSRGVRFKCHAGCDPKAVAEAMATRIGRTVADFFEPQGKAVGNGNKVKTPRPSKQPLTIEQFAAA